MRLKYHSVRRQVRGALASRGRDGWRRPSWAVPAALVAVSVVSAGCGSVHGDGEFARGNLSGTRPPAGEAAQDSRAPVSGVAPLSSEPTPSEAVNPDASSVTPRATSASPAPGSASGSGSGARQDGSSRSATPGGGPEGPAAGSAASPSAGATPTPGTQPGAGAAPATPAPGDAGPKSTIVIGSLGNESGPIGQVLGPGVQAARAWATDVNARGGLNGHPVRLVVADDGGDPNRSLALARRMVDEDKVAAFYMERMPTTFQAVAPFLEQRRVPLIGSCNCTDATARSPMGFEVGPGGGLGFAWSHVAPLLAFSDKRKVSIFYCREVATCATIRNNIRDMASAAKLDIVHEAQVTITQPDYSAELLAAQSAGAEAVLLAVEGASAIRVMRSANRQNLDMEFSMQHGSHDDRFPKAGGADVEGALVSAGLPHWESPKMADYRRVMARYAPDAALATLSATSWAAGKLMEVIATGFGDQVTSDDFLRGLYGLRGETLGGVIPPLTYVEGQGSDHNSVCTIPTRLEKGRFVSKNGDEYSCLPGWQPPRK